MRGVRFLILLLIAIPLGWYAYHDSKKGAVDDSPKRDKVFTVEADKIDEIEIKSESGDRTTGRKKGTDWEIVQPISSATDQASVSGITSNLSVGSAGHRENPPDLKEFGPRAASRGGVHQRPKRLRSTKTPAPTCMPAARQQRCS
jgi:hypothetical protein